MPRGPTFGVGDGEVAGADGVARVILGHALVLAAMLVLHAEDLEARQAAGE